MKVDLWEVRMLGLVSVHDRPGAQRVTHERDEVVHQPAGVRDRRVQLRDHVEHARLRVLEEEPVPEGEIGGVQAPVLLGPVGVRGHERREPLLGDVLPGPGREGAQDGGGRLRQQIARTALGSAAAHPEPGDDPEAASAAARHGPGQVVVGVVRVTGGDDRPHLTLLVHGDDLDGVDVIADDAVRAGEDAVTAPGEVAPGPRGVTAAPGEGDAPADVQQLVDLEQGRARLHDERLALLVEAHVVHQPQIDDDLALVVEDEVRETVPAAAHRDPLAVPDGLSHDLDDLLGGGGNPDGLGGGHMTVVAVASDHVRVAGVLGRHRGNSSSVHVFHTPADHGAVPRAS